MQTLGFGKLLQLLCNNAWLADDEPIGCVKVEYFIHAIKCDYDLTRVCHRAAAQARAATRGDQRHFHTLCKFNKRDHFVGVGGQHNRNGRWLIDSGPVFAIGVEVGGRGLEASISN